MICLDCNTAIAAFQKDPPKTIAMYRDRVRYFLRAHPDQRLLFPSVGLSEYLWKADRQELETAIRTAVGRNLLTPAFDEATAFIAANVGRKYSDLRKSVGHVAKVVHDRVVLKHDLLIVATALQHQARYLLTHDLGCCEVAKFAGLPEPILLCELPEPPPPPTPRPATGRATSLFDLLGDGEQIDS